ncbi:DMT family transporter [Frondihabitans australicus]|uniref:Putative membrane protein n=1 Tax=Frondihabitans australicus TaxID=386892 RepID=A0A495IMP0_9MICO|nr:EamA family transporter [Frondihabitans australicus]RKR76471.1 putative membrane protein [Frondihabitans australicus]
MSRKERRTPLITVALGLGAALIYGVADFLGGLASRSLRPLVVTAVTAGIGIVPLLIALPLLGASFTGRTLVWGLAAGASGAVGVVLLYSALAIGPMSILSPVTSVFSALLPVTVSLLTGSRLSPLGDVAIVAALVAMILVASVKDASGARLTPRGLISAAVAGCGFGGIVLAYDASGSHAGLAPLVVSRVLQTIAMSAGVALVVRRSAAPAPHAFRGGLADEFGPLRPLRSRGPRRLALVVVACGLADATANALIQAALHATGTAATLPTVSVLYALYPIGTVVLAAIVLRERLTAVQIGGLALGFAASAVLALG